MNRVLLVYLLLIYAVSSTNVISVDHSKVRILDYVPEMYTFRHFVGSPNYIRRILIRNFNSGTFIPLVMKPDMCAARGKGVKLVSSYNEAMEYLKENKVKRLVVEEYSDLPYECGVLYIRYPWENKGYIKSITQKVLVKKGRIDHNLSTSKYFNRTNMITPQLTRVIDGISKRIPGFHYGRYDIKFKSFSELQRGVFKVIEVNGVMSCDLNLYLDLQPKNILLFPIIEILKNPQLYLIRIIIGMWNIFNIFNYPTIITERCKDIRDIYRCRKWTLLTALVVIYIVLIGIRKLYMGTD